MNAKKYSRRQGALSRLELQLESGNKTTRAGVVDLSDNDRKRISREIAILSR